MTFITFNRIANYLYWLGIILIILPLIDLFFSGIIPIEFKSCTFRQNFHITMIFSLPIGILLTIFKLFRGEINYTSYIVKRILFKIVISFTYLYLIFFTAFMLIFFINCWKDDSLLFENKKNKEIIIVDQIWDEGALGYGGHRIVKINPILPGLIYVKQIDTSKLENTNWIKKD
jgi:hypothetical protein